LRENGRPCFYINFEQTTLQIVASRRAKFACAYLAAVKYSK
jgi:hypothetical protein